MLIGNPLLPQAGSRGKAEAWSEVDCSLACPRFDGDGDAARIREGLRYDQIRSDLYKYKYKYKGLRYDPIRSDSLLSYCY